jgi:nitrate/nitrite transporter NarK
MLAPSGFSPAHVILVVFATSGESQATETAQLNFRSGSEASDRGHIREVLRPVLLPGLGFALSGITFGAVTAFLTLYFSVQGWANGALAFTVFAVALIVARLVAGHLPDRFGGARVALCCLGGKRSGC